MQPTVRRSVTRDKLRPPGEHKSPFRRRTEKSKFSCSSVNQVNAVCSSISCKGAACIVVFLYHVIVVLGWAPEALLLSETLLKASFYVHWSLHVTTSFLPFTVDVTAAISRAHHKLASCCDWNKCLGGVGQKTKDHDGKVPQIQESKQCEIKTWPIFSPFGNFDWNSKLRDIWV